jgi:hypothetical protein
VAAGRPVVIARKCLQSRRPSSRERPLRVASDRASVSAAAQPVDTPSVDDTTAADGNGAGRTSSAWRAAMEFRLAGYRQSLPWVAGAAGLFAWRLAASQVGGYRLGVGVGLVAVMVWCAAGQVVAILRIRPNLDRDASYWEHRITQDWKIYCVVIPSLLAGLLVTIAIGAQRGDTAVVAGAAVGLIPTTFFAWRLWVRRHSPADVLAPIRLGFRAGK